MGEGSAPEIWSVDRGKLYKPESVLLKNAERVPSGVSNAEDADSSLRYP